MQRCILHYVALFSLLLLTACGGGAGTSRETVLPGGASNQSQVPAVTSGVHFTEYSLRGLNPPAPVHDDGTVLPDGTIWLNVNDALHVTSTGAKILDVSIFDPNCGIICDLVATGLTYHASNNSLWYAVLHFRGTVSGMEVDWIDATTGAREGATDSVDSYSKPVNGPDGRVWATACGGGIFGGPRFCRADAINPVTKTITPYDLGSDHSASLIAASTHGFLYVFETDIAIGNPQVVELSTSGVELNRFNAPDTQINDMAEGSDGNLWMIDSALNEVIRMTPAGSFHSYPIPTARATPAHILRATDGNMWFTEIDANQIARITPSGSITEFPVPSERAEPDGIFGLDASACAISAHGFFYITEDGPDALARVDF